MGTSCDRYPITPKTFTLSRQRMYSMEGIKRGRLMLRGVGDTLKKKPDTFLVTFALWKVKTFGRVKIENVVSHHIS